MKALITGITGQDGSYLAERLLELGYEVHGTIRRSSSINTGRIDHLYNNKTVLDKRLFLHYADMTDNSVCRIIENIEPDVIYNLAAQSHVAVSFMLPEYTDCVNYMGVVRILDCIKRMKKPVKLYQASTSEMFGSTPPPQTENSVFRPCSPYGIAKLAAHQMCINYRESYDMFISCGILFNHESPRRGETFLTRKVSIAAAKIKLGLTSEPLSIGNIKAERDWGWAPEYVNGMVMMMERDEPGDYILATGENHTVQEFIEKAFNSLDMDIYWTADSDGNAVGAREKKNQNQIVKIDKKYFRPLEVDSLKGNPQKAKQDLNWSSKFNFDMIVSSMVRNDFNHLIKFM